MDKETRYGEKIIFIGFTPIITTFTVIRYRLCACVFVFILFHDNMLPYFAHGKAAFV